MSAAPTELDLVRREYESSLSWRVTKPLRALARLGRAARPLTHRPQARLTTGRYDSWLEHFHGDSLSRIDAACAAGGSESFALFRELDADLWALLLTQEFELYPNIKSVLPAVPDPSLQQLWNGASGAVLANQTKAFYAKLRERFAEHSAVPFDEARVLDFGCGWGRILRYLARDVAPGRLYGCDPVEQILDVCRQSRVPASLARSEFMPDELPFQEQFDLAYAFSVFTHVSERAHEASLRALHAGLNPGGILIVTVRPPEYLELSELMHPALQALGRDPFARLAEPRYIFVPHAASESHPQYAGGEMTYGETVITLPYIRERWLTLFELLDVDLLIGDLHQVMLTLRRR